MAIRFDCSLSFRQFYSVLELGTFSTRPSVRAGENGRSLGNRSCQLPQLGLGTLRLKDETHDARTARLRVR